MSDLHATKERLAEALELERLRKENDLLVKENDRLKARVSYCEMRLNYHQLKSEAGSLRSLSDCLGFSQPCELFGPSSLQKHMQAERFRLFGF